MNRIRVTSRCAYLRNSVCHGSVSRDDGRRTRLTQPWHVKSAHWLGFTLVELLVVVTVMLILIVMTVSSIDFTFMSERVKSGSRQVQSALAGARDRAIFAQAPRGLRLLVDQTDPRIVTSLVYVGGSKNWAKGQIRLERPDFDEDAGPLFNGQLDPGEDANGNGRLDGDGISDPPKTVVIVRGDATCGWNALKERGFLGLFEDRNLNGVLDLGEDLNGNGLLDLDAPRIKIPGDDNGSWYTVLTHRLSPTSQVLQLITPYRDPGTTPTDEVNAFQGGGPNTYILELPPRILPDAQPILLPEGVCIDLDGSDVPASWRPAPGAGLTVPYSSHMDVMFSPRGVVTGPLAAAGLVHLYVSERKDWQKLIDIGVLVGTTQTPRPPVNSGSLYGVPGQNQFGPDDSLGHRSSVSIFTQTGKVSAHQIYAIDVINNVTGVSGSDGYADTPFYYATQGEATNQ